MSVSYEGNKVKVDYSEKDNKDLVIYAHPKDEIDFNLDISGLKKEIVGGDLLIHLLNGKTITLVNYGLMTIDGESPTIKDIKNDSYNGFELFSGKAYSVNDDVSKYVISRQVSSPDSNLPPGDQLSTSDLVDNAMADQGRKVGNQFTEEQNPVSQVGSLYLEYITKTLLHNTKYSLDIMTTYNSNDKFIFDNSSTSSFPIKEIVINPDFQPEYGNLVTIIPAEAPSKYNMLNVYNGRGVEATTTAQQAMFSRYVVDYQNYTKPMEYDGIQDENTIYRNINLYVPNDLVSIKTVTLTDVPVGIEVYSPSSSITVKQLNQGSWSITYTGGASNSVQVSLSYPVGLGGSDGYFSSITAAITGSNSLTGDQISGRSNFILDIKPVYSFNDISTDYNTFTYSNLRSNVEIYFGGAGNIVHGDNTDSIYHTGGGNDVAYGGTGKEVFDMQGGINIFHSYIGNDTVDGGGDINGQLFLTDSFKSASNVTLTLASGNISLSGKDTNGNNFLSNFTNFYQIFFNDNSTNPVAPGDHILNISNTSGFANDVTINMGSVNDGNIIKIQALNYIEIRSNGNNDDTFRINSGGSNSGFIINENGSNIVYGSSSGATIYGDNTAINLTFYGVLGANNVADYSNLTQYGLTFNANTWEIDHSNGKDIIYNINKIIGGSAGNDFIASLNSSIDYEGYQSTNNDTLDYSQITETSNITFNTIYGTISKTNGGNDTFKNINTIIGGIGNDTFIMSDTESYTLDGKAGQNTLDYRAVISGINVDFTAPSGTTVSFMSGNVDTVNNFTNFYGSYSGGDSFKMADPFGYNITVKSGSVDYSSSSKNLVLDLGQSDSVYDTSIPSIKDIFNGILNFKLGSGNNTVNISDANDLINYTLDGGSSGNNIITFINSSSSISIDFSNSDVGGNISNFKELDLSNNNDSVIMTNNLSNVFPTIIDAEGGINSIDFSGMNSRAFSGTVDFNNLDIIYQGKELKNFEQYKGSSLNDTFFIKVQLGSQSGSVLPSDIANKLFRFDGAGGLSNTLNLKQVTFDSSMVQKGVTIDFSIFTLSDGGYSVNVGNYTILHFNNFKNIIGTDGDDVFILPTNAAVVKGFSIDGGGGTNTISYEKYTSGQNITTAVLSTFKNIQNITGSQGEDTFSLEESNGSNKSLGINGLQNFNIIKYVGTFSNALPNNISVSNSNIIIKKGSDNSQDTIIHSGEITFSSIDSSSSGTFISNGFTYNITTDDNSKIGYSYTNSSNQQENDLYLSGYSATDTSVDDTKFIADYSSLSSNLTLNLDVVEGEGEGSWITVEKGSSSNVKNVDYLQYIGKIVLASGTSSINQVQVYNSFINNYSEVTNKPLIITGQSSASKNLISFENYTLSSNIIIDVSSTIKNIKIGTTTIIQFSNFTQFKGSDVSSNEIDIFKSTDSGSYTFDGMQGNNEYDASALTALTSIEIAGSSTGNGDTTTITKSTNNIDTFTNLNIYRGSSSVASVITIKDTINFNLDLDSQNTSNNSSISYLNYNSSSTSSIIFNIDSGTVFRENNLYVDQVKNFYSWIGSKTTSDIFYASKDMTTERYYDGGGSTGNNNDSITLSALTDGSSSPATINFTLQTDNSINVVNSSTSTTFANLKNLGDIAGSATLANVFNFTNFNATSAQYNSGKQINLTGNISASTPGTGSKLNLDTVTSYDMKLDTATGVIELIDSSKATIGSFKTSGINEIDLGNGTNVVDCSSGTNLANWVTITADASSTSSSVSFSKSATALNYNLTGSANGTSGITFNNFNGIIGSKANDTFYLNNADKSTSAKNIDGSGGTGNILDYSALSDINITFKVGQNSGGTGTVVRGSVTDIINNIQIFKGGSSSGTDNTKAITYNVGSYSNSNYNFIAGSYTLANNKVDYSSVSSDLIFNFVTNSVLRGSYKDSFSNITTFTGGTGNNVFQFDTVNLASGTTITLIGNSDTSKTNQVNFSNLSGSNGFTCTFGSSSVSFTVPKVGSGSVTINVTNINNIFGSSYSDTFVVNSLQYVNDGFIFNGGANVSTAIDKLNFSQLSNSVTVDLLNNKISYSGSTKTNTFQSITSFVGSNSGNNVFTGLGGDTNFTIDGGSGGSNSVTYDAASLGLTVTIKSGQLNIAKAGTKSDTLSNIQSITLSNFNDTLKVANSSDLTVYANYNKIDASLGSNTIDFSGYDINLKADNIKLDLSAKTVTINTNASTNFKVNSFQNIKFSTSSTGNLTVVNYAPASLGSSNLLALSTVDFGSLSGSHELDLTNLTEGVSINFANNNTATYQTFTVKGINSSNSLNITNISILDFGKTSSSAINLINYTQFDPFKSGSSVLNTTSGALVNLTIQQFFPSPPSDNYVYTIKKADNSVKFIAASSGSTTYTQTISGSIGSLSIMSTSEDLTLETTISTSNIYNLNIKGDTHTNTINVTGSTGGSINLDANYTISATDSTNNLCINGIFQSKTFNVNFADSSNSNNTVFLNTANLSSIVNIIGNSTTTVSTENLPVSTFVTWNITSSSATTTLGKLVTVSNVKTFKTGNNTNTFNITDESSVSGLYIINSSITNKDSINFNFAVTTVSSLVITSNSLSITPNSGNAYSMNIQNIEIINLNGTGGQGYDAATSSVTFYNGLKEVDFYKNSTSNGSENSIVNISSITTGSTISLNYQYSATSAINMQYINASFNYSGGVFLANNMHISGSSNTTNNLTLSTGNDIITLASTYSGGSVDFISQFSNVSNIPAFIINGNGGNDTFDASDSSFALKGQIFTVTVKTSEVDVSFLNTTTSANQNIWVLKNGINTVKLNLTEADTRSAMGIVNFASTSEITTNYNISMGQLANMTLPSNLTNSKTFETTTNLPSKTTYYLSQVSYSGYNGSGGSTAGTGTPITADLFYNSNNLSTITRGSYTDTIDGFNALVGTGYNSTDGSSGDKFIFHNIANASYFNVWSNDKGASGNLNSNYKATMDFSSINDGNKYQFISEYYDDSNPFGSSVGKKSLTFVIASDNTNRHGGEAQSSGTLKYGSEMIYGNISMMTNLILTAGNDTFRPDINLQGGGTNPRPYDMSLVDGAGGENTYSLYQIGRYNRYDISFSNTGFTVYNTNTNNPSASSAYPGSYQNFNVFEGSGGTNPNDYAAEYLFYFNTKTQMASTVDHNFLIRRAYANDTDNKEVPYASGSTVMHTTTMYGITNDSAKSTHDGNFNIYFSHNYEFISSGESSGASNITFTGKNFAVTKIDVQTVSIVLGNYIDLSGFQTTSTTSSNLIINITGDSTANLYDLGTSASTNYTYSLSNSNTTLTITDGNSSDKALVINSAVAFTEHTSSSSSVDAYENDMNHANQNIQNGINMGDKSGETHSSFESINKGYAQTFANINNTIEERFQNNSYHKNNSDNKNTNISNTLNERSLNHDSLSTLLNYAKDQCAKNHNNINSMHHMQDINHAFSAMDHLTNGDSVSTEVEYMSASNVDQNSNNSENSNADHLKDKLHHFNS